MKLRYAGELAAKKVGTADDKPLVRRNRRYDLVCGHSCRLSTPPAKDEELLWCERCSQWVMVTPQARNIIRKSPVVVNPTRKSTGRPKGSSGVRLTADAVLEMRRLYDSGEMKQLELVKKFGVNRTTVYSIVHRRTWKEIS